MRNRNFLKNLSVAYPGTLGIKTEKGQQNNYPLVLDAPTESYEIMLLRYESGVFEVGASPPVPPSPVIVDFVTYQGLTVFYEGQPVTYTYIGA